MAETDTEPQEAPDTPEEEVAVTFPALVEVAADLARNRRKQEALEHEEKGLRDELLEKWDQVPMLHGIRLSSGDAVRKTWTTSQSKIDPVKLREALADAPNYIHETVDASALRKDYGTVWRQMAKAKSRWTIAVRLANSPGERSPDTK